VSHKSVASSKQA